MEAMKDLSIIIPHKNSLQTLNTLIESIPVHDWLEVLIVDDHSDGKVVEYIKRTFSGISHIRVFENESNIFSAGEARNIGLEHANGKWIVFADADDYFLESFSEEFEAIKQSSYDVIFYRPLIDADVTSSATMYGRKFDLYFKNKTRDNLERLKLNMDPPWSKTIRKNYLTKHQIKFDRVGKHDDTMFSIQVAINTENVHIVNTPIYHYSINSNSLSFKNDDAGYLAHIDVASRVIKVLMERYTREQLMIARPYEYLTLYRALFHILKISLMSRRRLILDALLIIHKNGVLKMKYFSLISVILAYWNSRRWEN